jgi:single-strand DNA-binding protein
MNSFTLNAIGNVATDLKLEGSGDRQYVRVPLIGNDYVGKDAKGEPQYEATTVYFVAFGKTAAAIANARKGDQLVINARVTANNWTDAKNEKHYDHSFIVEGFTFGAPGKLTRAARAA